MRVGPHTNNARSTWMFYFLITSKRTSCFQLQHVVVCCMCYKCCSVLSVLQLCWLWYDMQVAVSCSVLQCVVTRCIVLNVSITVRCASCSVLQSGAECCNVSLSCWLWCDVKVSMHLGVLQCVAAWCSVLQCCTAAVVLIITLCERCC